jgi:hypothetical protein
VRASVTSPHRAVTGPPPAGARLCHLDGAPANGTITLPPFGVGVFRIENGDAAPGQ